MIKDEKPTHSKQIKMKLPFAILSTLAIQSSASHTTRPRQGVFLNSNQLDNEIGVWESLDDGSLVWNGRYATGGTGYPDPLDNRNLDDLGTSNGVHYHVWNQAQWLLAVNAGGPEGNSSLTIFQVQPGLELIRKDVVPLNGTFACTVAGHGDRACAMTCALNVTLECFKISPAGKLSPEFEHDFQADLPIPEGRPNRVSAALGPGNVLFSPDGDQIGVVMKGSARLTQPHPHRAGFFSFPISARIGQDSGYGPPSFLELPNEIIPFAFVWRRGVNSNKPIAFTVNIAGASQDYPECDETLTCYSSVTSIATDSTNANNVSLSIVQDAPLNVIDGCWVEYRANHIYTGNFFSDSITVAAVTNEGAIEVERTVPIGIDTVPNDVVTTGPKLDGSVYLYSENQGLGDTKLQSLGEIGVHRVLTDGRVQVLPGAPIPSGLTPDAWVGNNGIAATSVSEQGLFDLYGFEMVAQEETTSSAAVAVSSVVALGMALLGLMAH